MAGRAVGDLQTCGCRRSDLRLHGQRWFAFEESDYSTATPPVAGVETSSAYMFAIVSF
jgi:hypothetical protein